MGNSLNSKDFSTPQKKSIREALKNGAITIDGLIDEGKLKTIVGVYCDDNGTRTYNALLSKLSEEVNGKRVIQATKKDCFFDLLFVRKVLSEINQEGKIDLSSKDKDALKKLVTKALIERAKKDNGKLFITLCSLLFIPDDKYASRNMAIQLLSEHINIDFSELSEVSMTAFASAESGKYLKRAVIKEAPDKCVSKKKEQIAWKLENLEEVSSYVQYAIDNPTKKIGRIMHRTGKYIGLNSGKPPKNIIGLRPSQQEREEETNLVIITDIIKANGVFVMEIINEETIITTSFGGSATFLDALALNVIAKAHEHGKKITIVPIEGGAQITV